MRIEHWRFTAPLRLKSILRRRRADRELDEELQFHLEQKIEEGIAEGLSPEEARYRALRAMGGLDQQKEEMRDMRHIHWLTDFLDDVRYAIRSLRRTPALTALIVVTIALGIGMTTTPFSMLDALIFRPYPVPHPGGVVTLVSTTHDNHFDSFSYREYLDIRDKTKSYEGVIANAPVGAVGFSAEPGTTPLVRGGILVSGNYFKVLGVEPQLGRGFREDEDTVPGRDAVMVLGPEFWKREFASDPSVVGRTVRLERQGLHRDRRRAGIVSRDADLHSPRLLHAPGDGASVFDGPEEGLLRGPGRSRAGREGAPEDGHDAAAGAQRARRAGARLRARVSRSSTATAARRCGPSSRCGRRTATSTGSSA